MAKQKPKTKKAAPSKPAKKTSAKAAPSKRKPAPAPAKKAAPAKKPTPAPKPAPAAKPVPAAKAAPVSMAKSDSKNALRANILKRKATAKPIAFSLDEVRAIAKTVSTKTAATAAAKPVKQPGKVAAVAPVKPAKPNHIKAASLADILGFNPKKQAKLDPADAADVPEKFKRYYKLLVDLRNHLTAGIELHSEETLKRSAKDDAGDLSSYGQHMADAGTDTFDRDFALSLVSSEQEALSEIDAAIKRVHAGTYGVCEHTHQPIPKERLLAVPFTRYTAEAQKEIERNRHRSRTQAGLFGEHGEDSGKMMEDSGDE
jgi:RNA polymerase-binding transcription factor DksA